MRSHRLARRWLPWLMSWAGWVFLIVEGDILGVGRVWWGVLFAVTLAVSVVAGVTQKRAPVNLLVALVVVIGAVRSREYAILEAWGPQGVWLVVIGSHLVMWLSMPVDPSRVHLECENAPVCPRRRTDDRRHVERRTRNLRPMVERRHTDRRGLAGM